MNEEKIEQVKEDIKLLQEELKRLEKEDKAPKPYDMFGLKITIDSDGWVYVSIGGSKVFLIRKGMQDSREIDKAIDKLIELRRYCQEN